MNIEWHSLAAQHSALLHVRSTLGRRFTPQPWGGADWCNPTWCVGGTVADGRTLYVCESDMMGSYDLILRDESPEAGGPDGKYQDGDGIHDALCTLEGCWDGAALVDEVSRIFATL